MLTDIANSVLKKIGYKILPKWREILEPQISYMRKLFQEMDPDLVLDVGANEGQYRWFLRNLVGYSGQIVSFEPIPEMVERCKSIVDRKWDVLPFALGEQAGTVRFGVAADTPFSSFLSAHAGADQLFPNQIETERSIDVSMSTLDVELPRLIEVHGARRPFLKMDTQGYDLKVVNGGAKVLDLFWALQTEVAVTKLYEDGATLPETLEVLNKYGFMPSAIFATGDHFPKLIDVDLYMVNRRCF